MGFFSWLFKRKPKKVKLGLALGSGGAKGFAELGALKAFEENGIEFEYIAGTSIGSIIGAFYANGYTSTDILSLLNSINPNEIKSLLMLNMDTMGLFKVIDRNIGTLKIEELKKSFCCIATEVDSGEEKVFNSGSVAKALCASSCYPPIFKPVIIDGVRYVDGAFSNSVPADKVKEMGADVVIGIDLATHDVGKSLLSMIFPTYKGKTDTPWKSGYDNSDVMLHPDLSDYKSTSFGEKEEMFDIGYREALKKIPEIKMLIENFSFKKRK